MDLQYVSRRATLSAKYAAAYVVPNVTLFSRTLLRGWEFSASLYNVFDHKYADPAGHGLAESVIFQDDRDFRIKAEYRFH